MAQVTRRTKSTAAAMPTTVNTPPSRGLFSRKDFGAEAAELEVGTTAATDVMVTTLPAELVVYVVSVTGGVEVMEVVVGSEVAEDVVDESDDSVSELVLHRPSAICTSRLIVHTHAEEIELVERGKVGVGVEEDGVVTTVGDVVVAGIVGNRPETMLFKMPPPPTVEVGSRSLKPSSIPDLLEG